MPTNMDFVNPIIQSMMFAQQKQQERDRLQQEADQFKESQGIRQHQLKLEETRIKNQEKHEEAVLANTAKQLSATLEANRLQRIGLARDLSAKGVDINKALASLGGEQMQGVPDTQTLQNQDVAQEAAKVRAHTSAQLEVAEPYKVAADQRRFLAEADQSQREIVNRLALEGVHQSGAERLAKINRDSAEKIAKWQIGSHERIAELNRQGLLGDAATQVLELEDGIFNGNIDYNRLDPKQKKAVSAHLASTGELSALPQNGLKYRENLNALGGVQITTDILRDLAANYSRDSPGAWEKGNQTLSAGPLGTGQRTRPGSELDRKLGELKLESGKLVTLYDNDRRKSDADVARAALAAFNPKATRKENLEALDKIVGQFQGTFNRTFTGMDPGRVAAILKTNGLRDFEAPKQVDPNWPKTNAKGHKLDEEESVKLGRPVYAGN